jgi:hypothetical protein
LPTDDGADVNRLKSRRDTAVADDRADSQLNGAT